jgi:hypothetical protein
MGDSEGDAAGKLFIGGVSWQTTEVDEQPTIIAKRMH